MAKKTKKEKLKLQSIQYSADSIRKAVVYTTQKGDVPLVEFFENDIKIRSRKFENHNLRYAEDAAENYINGLLDVTK